MNPQDTRLAKSATSLSLSSPEGGEGRGEEGHFYWFYPLPDPLPTPPSWGEGTHRELLCIPLSPEYFVAHKKSFAQYGFNRSNGAATLRRSLPRRRGAESTDADDVAHQKPCPRGRPDAGTATGLQRRDRRNR